VAPKRPSEDFGELATSLCALIGQDIVAAGPLGERTMLIRIGHTNLELIDDSDQFESFVIEVGKEKFVV